MKTAGDMMRHWVIDLGPTTRVTVSVTAFEDHSLPVPFEKEDWRERQASDEEVVKSLLATTQKVACGK